MSFEVYSPWRLGASAYRDTPFAAQLHAMPLLYISSISTTNNSCADGGDSCRNATGPIGYESGVAFSSYYEIDNNTIRAVNRALITDNYIYYLMGDVLWRTNYSKPHETDAYSSHDGFIGNPWNSVASFTNPTAGRAGLNTGIYSCMLNTSGVLEEYIVCAWKDKDSNGWRGLRHLVNTGNTLESSAINISLGATTSTGGVKAEILHNNKIYFIGTTSDGIGVFNPETLSFSKISWGSNTVWGPHDFCAYKGKLYVMNRSSSTASGVLIWEVGNELQTTLAYQIAAAETVTTDNWASEQYEGRGALFTDRNFLYATYQAHSATGYLPGSFAHRMFKLLDNGNGALVYVGENEAVSDAEDTVRTNIFTYQDSNPDNPIPSSAGQLVIINWEKSGATGVAVTQGVISGNTYEQEESVYPPEADNNAWNFYLRCTAKPHCKNGGGERVLNPVNTRNYGGSQGVLPELFGGPRVSLKTLRVGSASGHLTVDFKIINNQGDFPAGTPLSVVLKHDRYGHMPFNRGKLVNPSVGTLAEDNTVMRIPSSDSGVLYSVEWAYMDNGYTYQSRPSINLFCATTGVS